MVETEQEPGRSSHAASLFLKLYGGMVLLVLLVCSSTWLALQEFNSWRAQEYREGVASGVFRLVAVGVSTHHGTELQNWLEEVSQLLGVPLELVSGTPQSFSFFEQHRLDQGRTVLRLNGDESAADVFVKVPAHKDIYVHTRMVRVSEQQGKAMALLFLDALQRADPLQRAQTFEDLSKYFSFPVSIVPVGQLNLDIEQRVQLDHDEVIMLLKQGNGPNSSSVRIMAPMPHHQGILVLGPLYLFNWMPVKLIVASAIFAIVAITLGAYVLMRPVERRIRRLELAVRKLRAGDLDARAEVDGRDELGQLGHAFNGMAEHIQRLINAQRDMLRAVSHELRTPVARIRFGVDMMADTNEMEERLSQLAGIDADIEELNKLIDEILTYARLEGDKPRLKIRAFSLPDLLQRIRQETYALRTPIHVDISAEDMQLVLAEEHYIHRLLQNLVGNAIRYAQKRVLVRCGENAHSNWLSVEDDGPGIPEQDRQRVFEPFARLDDSRTRASGGYGLGLSIVQKIAHWHEGTIRIEQSELLGGACFVMTWPKRLSKSVLEPVTQSNSTDSNEAQT